MKRLTATDRLMEKNRKANLKHKANLERTGKLHIAVRDGLLTAHQALQIQCGLIPWPENLPK